jgi:transposase
VVFSNVFEIPQSIFGRVAKHKGCFFEKGRNQENRKSWERIGRAKEKHKHVSARYKISVENQAGKAIDMKWEFVENKIKQDKSRGVYFIRTNHDTTSESKLWDVYNTIREVEATFRGLKTDLNIRPVHHQNDDRIDAHMYLTILAYQLVNTIRHMLKNNGINHGWKNIVRIMSTQKIQTIQIPTDKKVIYLRKPSKPINEVQQIYSATRCENTQKPIKKYVVYH